MLFSFDAPDFPFYGRIFSSDPIPVARSNRFLESDDVVLISDENGSNEYMARPLANEDEASNVLFVTKSLISRLKWPSLSGDEKVFVTVAPYSTSEAGYLSFDKGTMVVVQGEEQEGWVRGTVIADNGKRLGGAELIPASFLLQLTPLNAISLDSTAAVDGETPLREITKAEPVRIREAENAPTPPLRPASLAGVLCTAIYEFKGSNEDELSFMANEDIRVLRSIDGVWFYGESIDGERRGMFPGDFVDLEPFGVEKKPSPSVPKTAPTMVEHIEEPEDCLGIAIVVGDFTARYDDELTISYGDCVKVVSFADTDWCYCYCLSRYGLVPKSFLHLLFTPPPLHQDVLIEEHESPVISETIEEVPPTPSESKAFLPVVPERTPPRDVPPVAARKEIAASGWSKEAEKRSFVVGEVISTESTYQRNLKLWLTFVNDSRDLSNAEKLKLSGGFDELINLSQSLLTLLRQEYAKSAEDQHIADVFAMLIDRIRCTFLLYVDCYITTYSVDQAVAPEIVDSLILQLRENGSSIFDAPSFFFEPFLRATRYRLLIEALLSNTPKGNPDHAALLKVHKNIRNLLSAIDGRLGSRLLNKQSFFSGITSHSFSKKSNRLKYRIKAIFGQNIIKDYEFDTKMRLLVAEERSISRFLYCLNVYKKKFALGIARWKETNAPNKNENVLPHCISKLLLLFSESEQIMADLIEEIDETMLPEAKALFGVADLKLIQRRNDKLADYETSLGKKDVSARSIRKAEFDALNLKLLQDLPKATETIRTKALTLVISLVELDRKYSNRLDACLRGRHRDIAYMKISSHLSVIDPEQSRLRPFKKLIDRLGGGSKSGKPGNRLNPNWNSDMISVDASSFCFDFDTKCDLESTSRKQSQLNVEDDNLIEFDSTVEETAKADAVLRWSTIAYDFHASTGNEISVRRAQRVGILREYDDDGNQDWTLVRNHAGKCGYVPSNYLAA